MASPVPRAESPQPRKRRRRRAPSPDTPVSAAAWTPATILEQAKRDTSAVEKARRLADRLAGATTGNARLMRKWYLESGTRVADHVLLAQHTIRALKALPADKRVVFSGDESAPLKWSPKWNAPTLVWTAQRLLPEPQPAVECSMTVSGLYSGCGSLLRGFMTAMWRFMVDAPFTQAWVRARHGFRVEMTRTPEAVARHRAVRRARDKARMRMEPRKGAEHVAWEPQDAEVSWTFWLVPEGMVDPIEIHVPASMITFGAVGEDGFFPVSFQQAAIAERVTQRVDEVLDDFTTRQPDLEDATVPSDARNLLQEWSDGISRGSATMQSVLDYQTQSNL